MPDTTNQQESRNLYRPDIDGLRGIAVLLVLLYHAGLGFPGGFIGVDVFFVISGFLITRNIIREINNDKFTLIDFYMRRARRILPASTLMLTFSVAVGMLLLLPSDLVELCQSAVSQIFFSANFFFWRNTGYFSNAVELKPLLHMWSMAVEEQFYLAYPVYLMVFPPTTTRGKAIFLGLFSLAIILGIYGHIRHPSAAFYLLPCRAWELLLGGLICTLPQSRFASLTLIKITAILGLAVITATACIAQNKWVYWLPPGLPACLSAMVIIHAGSSNPSWVSKFLSFKPLVWTGMISYSLYLYHWPILSYLKHVETDLGFAVSGVSYRLSALILTFVIAFLSWKFIEEPFRRRNILPVNRTFLAALTSASAIILFICLSGVKTGGFPKRFDERVVRYAAAANEHGNSFARSMSSEQVNSDDLFAAGLRNSTTRILLFGDSHGMLLMHGLAPLADQAAIRLDQATRYSTVPLLGFNHKSWNSQGAEDFCSAVYNLIDRKEYDCVVLSAAWHSYYRESPNFEESFNKSIGRLRKASTPICIILPVPSQNIPLPQALCATVRLGRNPNRLGVPLDQFERDTSQVTTLIRKQSAPDFYFADPLPVMVDQDRLIRCEFDGHSMYSDNFHLSHFGAERVAKHVFPEILKAMQTKTISPIHSAQQIIP